MRAFKQTRKKATLQKYLFIDRKIQMVHITLLSCQPKETRQDKKNLQCQSTTKPNKPQWQTLSWTWPPRKYAWNFATIQTRSHRHPGRHRSDVYANRSTKKRPTSSAIHVETTKQPRIRGVRIPTTHLWSQGLTSLLKFCFATDSQRRHRRSPKFSGDHSADILHGWHGGIFQRKHHSIHYSQGCQAYSEKGKFNLTKWCSNSREFYQQMQDDLCKPVEELFSKTFHQRVLGIHWSLDEDKIMFKAKDRKNLDRKTWTQRKFLSFVSSFHDPLGIISPFLIRSKILLQELWKHGREWDKAISGHNGNAIKDWVEETELLGTVGLNRLIGGTGLGDTMELHVFCDASLGATAGSGSIHQDNQQPKNHNSFSYGKKKSGKNKSGTFTSNNNYVKHKSGTFTSNPTRYEESAMPKHHKTEKASMTNS